MAAKELTPKQQRFVSEYLIDLNATQAAIRAGYSERTARSAGAENLTKPDIAAAIATRQAKRAQRTDVTADKVLRQWWELAHADTNELVEHRVHCCRHCYGEGFGYQRTAQEFARDHGLAEKAKAEFDARGGAGYDRRKAPNPDCTECFGDGVTSAYFKDTRHLTPAARRLYAGVKITKDGVEVKMHDPMAALANVAKHLGMFTEHVDVTTGGHRFTLAIGEKAVASRIAEHFAPVSRVRAGRDS